MAILNDELTIWDISFRWAGYDPGKFYLRYPLPVKDNFRLIMSAILEGEIICNTLCLDKRPSGSKADPAYYIRTYIDDVYACIHDKKYNRNLLKWAEIDRKGFLEWCTRRGIAPPEFWFPTGWKVEYDHSIGSHPGFFMRHKEPEDENTTVCFSFYWPESDVEENQAIESDSNTINDSSRPSQKARVACQVIALNLWKTDINISIADMVKRPEIRNLGGAASYANDVVRRWLSEVAPAVVSARIGRPKKKNITKDD